MKLKSALAGIIVAATMAVVVPAQAGEMCGTEACGPWNVPSSFTGTGWGMVPCGTVLQPADSWQEYASGQYAPPTTGKGILIWQ